MIKTTLPKQENKLESKYITLQSGIRTHYIDAGPPDAPVVLLTHGFLSSVRDWKANMLPLAENSPKPLRFIALDWAGFGLSDKGNRAYSLYFFADFLRDFAIAMGLESFDLVGHSMGGKHNLAFAIFYPQYIRKFVLVDTDGFITESWMMNSSGKPWFKPIQAIQLKALGSPRLVKAFFSQAYHDKSFIPGDAKLKEGVRMLTMPDQIDALKALNQNYPSLSMRLTGLIERVPEIEKPTLIVWGRQDRIIHISCAEIAKSMLKNSRLHIFEECGHIPQIEKASEFNKLLLEFLNED
ncbi:MAG: alpha/beta hydrolase [Chloroflexi bacterium]|uniref:Alpha/beta hydrolase n=1 Tax=Candidatus Chlorohelix allophototropha TaxID=3003348 RepID=A0A8T7M5H0_9CHLR|nr:alpha/beta hydrolase [Chloroflexota bacterium]WJW69265.1 alpha/beta hydrolase [Chloroflexota bacterium L227-S17]